MKIQNFVPSSPMRALPASQPTPPQTPATPPQADQVELSSQPTPPSPQKPSSGKGGAVLKSALMGAAALALPTAIGAATGIPGAAVLGVGGAVTGLAFGKASGFITLDFRLPAALALGGGGAALALAGNAFGGPAVGIAALAGAGAMTALMLRK